MQKPLVQRCCLLVANRLTFLAEPAVPSNPMTLDAAALMAASIRHQQASRGASASSPSSGNAASSSRAYWVATSGSLSRSRLYRCGRRYRILLTSNRRWRSFVTNTTVGSDVDDVREVPTSDENMVNLCLRVVW
uniref:(northern house mosquito) hypothetical protein n=1 Tax=Culex pipiens TaxID=7175 RepID=A0A8D8A9U9_CULPI